MLNKEKIPTQDNDQRIVSGLDIGTTKISAISGKRNADGSTVIIGAGTTPSEGLSKGVITDIASAVKSIKEAVYICEQQSGKKFENVYVGIAGQHIESKNADGVVAVKDDIISHADIERVIESAVIKETDKEIIHILSQEYMIDGQDGVKDPVGMAGRRLQAKVHTIFGSTTATANLYQSCADAGLDVNRIVLEPLASAYSVLSKEERELGVILLDIGGGTTDIVIYKNNSVVQTAVIPIGGNHLTNDISVGLRTRRENALHLKHTQGVSMANKINENEIIKVVGFHNRPETIYEKRILGDIIEARFREIFELVYEKIKLSGFESIATVGVVLTGGSSLLKDLDLLAEDVMQLPVKIGTPSGISGLSDKVNSPIYATGVGLVKYGLENYTGGNELTAQKSGKRKSGFSMFNINDLLNKFF